MTTNPTTDAARPKVEDADAKCAAFEAQAVAAVQDLQAVEASLAEREAELAKAQEWVEESQSCFAELRDVGKSNSRIDWLYEETSKYLNSRHAARQQQKDRK